MGYKLLYRSRSQPFPIDFHSSYKLTAYTVTSGLRTGDRVDIIEWNGLETFSRRVDEKNMQLHISNLAKSTLIWIIPRTQLNLWLLFTRKRMKCFP